MHKPIVKAVAAGDPEAAASAMRKHALQFGKTLMEMELAFRKKRGSSAL